MTKTCMCGHEESRHALIIDERMACFEVDCECHRFTDSYLAKFPISIPNTRPDIRRIEDAPRDGTKIIGIYEDGDEIEIRYAQTRICMLAGIGGGNGYFGEGWEDTYNGLIADEPEFWRPIT